MGLCIGRREIRGWIRSFPPLGKTLWTEFIQRGVPTVVAIYLARVVFSELLAVLWISGRVFYGCFEYLFAVLRGRFSIRCTFSVFSVDFHDVFERRMRGYNILFLLSYEIGFNVQFKSDPQVDSISKRT